MNREEIMELLPHRDNMLLLDAAHMENDEAHGEYRVKGDEWFLQGHFPGNPVVPGVVLCEIMAQSACVLLSDVCQSGKLLMYSGLDRVRFKASVRPGDLFETRCRLVKRRDPFYFLEGSGYVGDKLCIKAEFSVAAVEV